METVINKTIGIWQNTQDWYTHRGHRPQNNPPSTVESIHCIVPGRAPIVESGGLSQSPATTKLCKNFWKKLPNVECSLTRQLSDILKRDLRASTVLMFRQGILPIRHLSHGDYAVTRYLSSYYRCVCRLPELLQFYMFTTHAHEVSTFRTDDNGYNQIQHLKTRKIRLLRILEGIKKTA